MKMYALAAAGLLLLTGCFHNAQTPVNVDQPNVNEPAAPAANTDNTNQPPSPADTSNTNSNTNEPAGVQTNAVTFNVSGTPFEFSIKEIRVKQGDTVTIRFTNNEGLHDWVLDEFSAATKQIGAGQTDSVTFVASQKGTFEYYCSVGQHRTLGMVGDLIVE